MPAALAPAWFVAYIQSTNPVPSVAFMITNFLPAAATFGQSIVPCQWLTSMPSSVPASSVRVGCTPAAGCLGGWLWSTAWTGVADPNSETMASVAARTATGTDQPGPDTRFALAARGR